MEMYILCLRKEKEKNKRTKQKYYLKIQATNLTF